MANVQKKNARGHRREEKKAAARGTAPAPKKRTKAEQARWEQMELEAQAAAAKRQENISRIVGVAIFALSVIFFFVAVIGGDGAWKVVHNVYLGLFGMLAAVLFPILAVAIILLYSYKENKAKKRAAEEGTAAQKSPVSPRELIAKGVESVIIVLLIAALIHIIENPTGLKFADSVKLGYTQAPYEFNGGFFGALIGWALLTFGKAPAIIVDLVLLVVDFMLLARLTVMQFLNGAAQPAKKAYEKAGDAIEVYRERRQANIDVPLDAHAPGEQETEEEPPAQKGKKKNTDAVDTDSIVKELNQKHSKKIAEKKQSAPEKAKSLDEIVDKATEEADPKKTDPSEVFTVTDAQMEAGVADYKLPPVSLLTPAQHKSVKDVSGELKSNAERLIDTLHSFNVDATITDISRGPTVTRYELKPATGVRISKITNLSDDIALNLAATHVRIEAPIPGKAAVGIEVPNSVKSGVSMRELIDTPEFGKQRSMLSVGLGRDISGDAVYCDVAKMPHLLIAGTTGSGKSVCMNSIIVSILYRAKPDEVKLVLIDPKKVEFSKYSGIPHLLVPVVTDPRKAAGALGWAVSEMLKRYQTFSDTGVRDIEGYNKYVKKHEDMQPMPKIVICIDELSDLMMAAPKEIEDSICRLAQMARAAGMHLVIATQRPSVDVITGLIKANISSRIALTVSSQIDSRTILDASGAEKLLGYGDMLYAPIGSSKPIRVQGCYISDEEVESLCDFVKSQGESQYSDEIQKEIEAKAVQDKKSPFEGDESSEQLDPRFEEAVEIVLETGTASTSFLQRKLSVGYARGAKIMDQLEEKGIIGPQDGAKKREVRINKQQWLEMQNQGPAPKMNAETAEQMRFEEAESDEDQTDAE